MRVVRVRHGRGIAIPIDAGASDTVTLSWPGGSATLEVDDDGLCTIDESVAAMIPAPEKTGDHTSCTLSWGSTTWLVDYVFDHTHHRLEARHRWQI